MLNGKKFKKSDGSDIKILKYLILILSTLKLPHPTNYYPDTLDTFLQDFPRDAYGNVGEFTPCLFSMTTMTTMTSDNDKVVFLCYVLFVHNSILNFSFEVLTI